MSRRRVRTLQAWTFAEPGAPVDAAAALEEIRAFDHLVGLRKRPLTVGPTPARLHMPGPIVPTGRKQRRKVRR